MFAQSRGKSHLRVADLLTTSLRMAVMLGCVVVCLIFTSLPVTAQEKPVTEDRSLIDKARDGDLEGVRLEILAGANVNERGIKDGTALHAAADWGHAHVVRALLELGAQPDRRDANRATACLWRRGAVTQKLWPFYWPAVLTPIVSPRIMKCR